MTLTPDERRKGRKYADQCWYNQADNAEKLAEYYIPLDDAFDNALQLLRAFVNDAAWEYDNIRPDEWKHGWALAANIQKAKELVDLYLEPEEKTKPDDMDAFAAFLRAASDQVATWPEWKRNILGVLMATEKEGG